MRAWLGSLSMYWLFILLIWGFAGVFSSGLQAWEWILIYLSVAAAVDGVRNEWLNR